MSHRALSLSEVCDLLCERKRTLILYHSRPDADAIGCAFALRALLLEMGIPAICMCTDEIPDRLFFLADSTQGSVVPSEDTVSDHERVITVDSASPQQLGYLFERYHRDIVLMIDHHASGTVYADHYIRPEAAATGEILYDIACELLRRGDLAQIPQRVYSDLYTAISSDTGCFRYANVTPATLRCAAALLEAGVDSAQINHYLFESKTLKQVRAEGEAARRLSIYDKGSIASVLFPYSSKFSLGLSDENLETIIDIPRAIGGVMVAFSVRQPQDSSFFRVSMRSNCDFDVSAVCAAFGGGGHHRAAGCSLEANGIEDAEKKILAEIRRLRDA